MFYGNMNFSDVVDACTYLRAYPTSIGNVNVRVIWSTGTTPFLRYNCNGVFVISGLDQRNLCAVSRNKNQIIAFIVSDPVKKTTQKFARSCDYISSTSE